ncbi:MAG: hydroxymethylbilane synthase [Candidatus Hydrogenedentes bacterium]|nr:hydroxymethylbilane synthase [Candidatus Hydrogenedentota bacterium]
MSGRIRIGTRGSKLARWQADWVAERLRERYPDLDVVIEVVKTTGDAVQDRPLAALGGDGLFTKELDAALLDNAVDAAVHSLKDLPTAPRPGLTLAAVPCREEPGDAFIGRNINHFNDLHKNARLGTGSLRRQAQARALRPDIECVPIRGNIDTRLRKLRESDELDGIIVAAAGVIRLGMGGCISELLDTEQWLPAPGQGALAVVVREGDADTLDVIAPLEDTNARAAVAAERAFLAGVAGGCHVPVGALARVEGGRLTLDGLIAAPDGGQAVRARESGAPGEALEVGGRLAAKLLSAGGGAILSALDRH